MNYKKTKLPVTNKWIKSERRIRPILDKDEKRRTLGTGCCYQIKDIERRDMKYVMKIVEAVCKKYHPEDSKWELIPEKGEGYLTLPSIAQVQCSVMLMEAGFTLFHIKDIGRIN